MALLVYVDDVLLVSDDLQQIQLLKKFLHDQFTIKDLGPLKYFLGLEIARSKTGISLCQRKYALDILQDTGNIGSKPAAFPMESNLNLTADNPELYEDPSKYRKLVGRLLYLTITRPDLAYSVKVLSQFLAKPAVSHHKAAMRVLRYLKATPGLGLLFSSSSELQLKAFSDSDSAEYRTLAATTCEVQWLVYALQDLQIDHQQSTALYTNNKSAMSIATNPIQHERTKHIQIDCHLVREKLQEKLIKLPYIPSRLQLVFYEANVNALQEGESLLEEKLQNSPREKEKRKSWVKWPVASMDGRRAL
ncbi:uncharacterized mitochondrial protein AtMg00810-like [Juglans microcarpa x Juglans regia]|uniref:uncharacterized mitochondrial protein AtMg00810-like n=1 Tax=Juglans microcarpa x Juglans regia TaxID=2249226 RepID=UPI001B7DEBFF|nr:uncharacterized mitochondrial protein AtMg00810-like [Juglans microcarpa x Juglans regia]